MSTFGLWANIGWSQDRQRLPPVAPISRQLQERREIEAIAAPEPAEPLSLEQLEEMALVSNPAIARLQALVSAARGNWVQVGLLPNPSAGYEGQQIGSGGLAEQDGVFVGQEFVRGGKLRLNRQIAAQEVARAQQELAAAEFRVRTDVNIGFYQVLAAQRQVEIANNLQRIAAEATKSAETLFNAKEVGRGDVLQAHLEAEAVVILSRNARNRHAAAWQSLAAVVGRPTLEAQPLQGDLEHATKDFAWDATLERLLSASPEIAVAVTNIERARWTVERARAEPRPNLNVQGLYNFRDEGIGGRPDGSLTVSLPIPAWNKNQGAVSQAQGELAAAYRALEQVELDLRNRLAPVYERYANSSNQVQRYREQILPMSKEWLDVTHKTYMAGEVGYLNMLTAQRTYAQNNLNYLEALRELRVAEAELDGMLLRGSLEAK